MSRKVWTFVVILTIPLMGVVLCNLAVKFGSTSRIFNSIEKLPDNKAGLVLGTSKYRMDGSENLFFKYRIQAAAQLYKAGKIEVIIVSGDNRVANYNEPREMRRELVKLGIPAHKIHLDYAGFRTLDSVVRCKEVFGQQKFTIISQQFHNERALFIAKRKDIDAVAFNAKDVNLQSGFKTKLREVFARVKVVIDLYVLKKQPKFLGEEIGI